MNRYTEVRKHLGLPSFKISESVGRGLGAYSDWERGIALPRYDALVKLQEVFHISPDYLILGDGVIETKGEFNPNFSTRLKVIRTDLGLSQNDFATLLGVSRQYYNYVENNKLQPSREFVVALADVTGRTLKYLIGGQ